MSNQGLEEDKSSSIDPTFGKTYTMNIIGTSYRDGVYPYGIIDGTKVFTPDKRYRYSYSERC